MENESFTIGHNFNAENPRRVDFRAKRKIWDRVFREEYGGDRKKYEELLRSDRREEVFAKYQKLYEQEQQVESSQESALGSSKSEGMGVGEVGDEAYADDGWWGRIVRSVTRLLAGKNGSSGEIDRAANPSPPRDTIVAEGDGDEQPLSPPRETDPSEKVTGQEILSVFTKGSKVELFCFRHGGDDINAGDTISGELSNNLAVGQKIDLVETKFATADIDSIVYSKNTSKQDLENFSVDVNITIRTKNGAVYELTLMDSSEKRAMLAQQGERRREERGQAEGRREETQV